MLRPVLLPILEPVLHFGLTSYRGGGAPWSPAALEPAVLLDPADLSTLFQNAPGFTFVTAAGQPVGLMLDKSQWGGKTLAQVLAAQPEMAANPGFDSNTSGWQPNGMATIAWDSDGGVGAALISINGSNGGLAKGQTFNLTPSVWHQVKIRVRTGTYSGNLALLVEGNSIRAITPLGAYTEFATFFVPTIANPGFVLPRIGSGTGTVYYDHISIKSVPGNHASQTVSAARPTLRQTGGVWYLEDDGVDDALNVDLPAGTYSWAYVDSTGDVTFEDAASSGGTVDVLRVPDLAGFAAIPRAAWTADEQAKLTAWWGRMFT